MTKPESVSSVVRGGVCPTCKAPIPGSEGAPYRNVEYTSTPMHERINVKRLLINGGKRTWQILRVALAAICIITLTGFVFCVTWLLCSTHEESVLVVGASQTVIRTGIEAHGVIERVNVKERYDVTFSGEDGAWVWVFHPMTEQAFHEFPIGARYWVACSYIGWIGPIRRLDQHHAN